MWNERFHRLRSMSKNTNHLCLWLLLLLPSTAAPQLGLIPCIGKERERMGGGPFSVCSLFIKEFQVKILMLCLNEDLIQSGRETHRTKRKDN